MSYKDRDRRDRDRDSSRRRDSRSPDRGRRDSAGPSRDRRSSPGYDPLADKNVLVYMKVGSKKSPLGDLNKYMTEKTKIKVWTRNFKEVRGIIIGYLLAFDKHWNLILRDVDEISLVSKKKKTPFLRDVEPNEVIADMPEKVPRKKKDPAEQPPPPPQIKKEKEEGDKKKRRPKKKKKLIQRSVPQMFVRGDNVVMLSPIPISDDEDEGEDPPSEATSMESAPAVEASDAD